MGTQFKKSVANLARGRRSAVRRLFDSVSVDIMSYIYWKNNTLYALC